MPGTDFSPGALAENKSKSLPLEGSQARAGNKPHCADPMLSRGSQGYEENETCWKDQKTPEKGVHMPGVSIKVLEGSRRSPQKD